MIPSSGKSDIRITDLTPPIETTLFANLEVLYMVLAIFPLSPFPRLPEKT